MTKITGVPCCDYFDYHHAGHYHNHDRPCLFFSLCSFVVQRGVEILVVMLLRAVGLRVVVRLVLVL